MFAIIDCNNFYVSCERLFRPDLKREPVIVLSNNDGCVIARSDEAKALGIGMGVPFFKVQSLVEKFRVKVFSSNYALYADLSNRVMSTIESTWPACEIYSIDEAFLDLSTLPEELHFNFLIDLQKKIFRNIGIPVSIGFGETKTLAKAANYIAKKIVKTPVFSLVDRDVWLSRMAINDIWNVGKRWGLQLQAYGIQTARDLAKCDPHWIRKQFNVMLMRTVMELNGIACNGLTPPNKPNASIISSRCFGMMQTELLGLSQAISRHAARVAEKARVQFLSTKRISLFVRSNPHRPDLNQYNNTITCPLIYPTQDTRVITRVALDGLKRLFKHGVFYKKVGVMLEDLVPTNSQQLDLFSSEGAESFAKSNRLMSVIDQINHRLGRHTVRMASEGYNQDWVMRSASRSPCYTTRWSDLLTVK